MSAAPAPISERSFKLFDSITTFLRSASQKQPIMLVLDDLHWSDKPSLLLLEFVARELSGARLLLVGTYRDVELNRRHPLAQTLGELTRERLFQRVLLRGLSQQESGQVDGVYSAHTKTEACLPTGPGFRLFEAMCAIPSLKDFALRWARARLTSRK